MICILPGCGFTLTEQQEGKWRSHQRRGDGQAGPFCSRECAANWQKLRARRAREQMGKEGQRANHL